jgi:hypothetical protein
MHLFFKQLSWGIFHRNGQKCTLLTPSMAKKRMAAEKGEIGSVVWLEGMSWAALCATARTCQAKKIDAYTSSKQLQGVD